MKPLNTICWGAERWILFVPPECDHETSLFDDCIECQMLFDDCIECQMLGAA